MAGLFDDIVSSDTPAQPSGGMFDDIVAAPKPKGLLSSVANSFKGAGARMAQGVNESLGSLDRAFGMDQGAQQYQENADYWKRKAEEAGSDGIAAKIYQGIGEAPAGVAEFMGGVPFAAVKGAAQGYQKDGLIGAATGAATEGVKRFGVGKVFHGLENTGLGGMTKAAAMGGTMGAQTAAEQYGATGEVNPEDVAASTATGAFLSLGHSGKQGEVRRNLMNEGVDADIASDLSSRVPMTLATARERLRKPSVEIPDTGIADASMSVDDAIRSANAEVSGGSEAISKQFLDPTMIKAAEQRRGAPLAGGELTAEERRALDVSAAFDGPVLSRDALEEVEANKADHALADLMANVRSKPAPAGTRDVESAVESTPVKQFAPGAQTALDNDLTHNGLIWATNGKEYDFYHPDEIATGKADLTERSNPTPEQLQDIADAKKKIEAAEPVREQDALPAPEPVKLLPEPAAAEFKAEPPAVQGELQPTRPVAPNSVITQINDIDGKPMGYAVAPHDGTPKGIHKAALQNARAAAAAHPDSSYGETIHLATDAEGKPTSTVNARFGDITPLEKKAPPVTLAGEVSHDNGRAVESVPATVPPADTGSGARGVEEGAKESAASPLAIKAKELGKPRQVADDERGEAVAEYQKALDRERPVEAPAIPAPSTPADRTAATRGVLETLAKPKTRSAASLAKLSEVHGRDTVNELAKSGLISFPGKGMAELTKKGKEWLEANPAPRTPAQQERYTLLSRKKKLSEKEQAQLASLSAMVEPEKSAPSNPLANQRGSAPIISDLLDSIRQTRTFQDLRASVHELGAHLYEKGMEFKEFAGRMKDALADMWLKGSAFVKGAYEYAKGISDDSTKSQAVGKLGAATPEEAALIAENTKGKPLVDVARWVVGNAPSEDYRMIAEKVTNKLLMAKAKGFKLGYELVGEEGHPDIGNGHGVTVSKENSINVLVKSGSSFEVVLHELIHAATDTSMADGRSGRSPETVAAMYDLKALMSHLRSVAPVGGEFADFENKFLRGEHNAFKNDSEVVAWAFTNKTMQKYMEAIPYGARTVWSKFVDAIRRVLGLQPKQNTALSEILRVGGDLIDAKPTVYDGKQVESEVRPESDSRMVEDNNGPDAGRTIDDNGADRENGLRGDDLRPLRDGSGENVPSDRLTETRSRMESRDDRDLTPISDQFRIVKEAADKLSKFADRSMFIKSDVKPAIDTAIEGTNIALDGINRAINPMARSKAAETAGRILIEGMGKKAHGIDEFKGELNRAIEEYNQSTGVVAKTLDLLTNSTGLIADKVFNTMPEKGRIGFMQAMDTGEKQATPQLQAIADTVKKMYDEKVAAIQALGNGMLENVRDSYFPHIWEKGEDAAKQINMALSKRPLDGTKSFNKHRVFDTIQEGLDAGYKLVSTNPMDLVFLKMHEMDKYLNAHTALQAMEGSGVVDLIPAGNRVPDGFTDIAGRYGTVVKHEFVDPTTGEVTSKNYRYVARDDVAQVFNNYLSKGLYHNPYVGKAYSAYMGAANTLNQFQLGVFSAFHAGFTSMEAVISHAALGVKAVAKGDFKGAGKYLAEAPAAWYTNPKLGDKIVKAWMGDPAASRELPHIVQWLEMAGARKELDNRFRDNSTQKMMQSWNSGNKVGAMVRGIPSVVEQSARPIMEWLVPRQKFGVFGEMANDWYQRNPDATHEEMRTAMQKIWNRVDSRLGQVNYDRLFTHAVTKNFVQALIRAPGWTGGTILEVGGGMKDLAGYLKNVSMGKKPELSDRAAYTLSMVMTTAIVNGALTYAFTGQSPQDWKDLVAFRTGNTDERGNPERFMLPTYMKDVYAYISDVAGGTPFRTLGHKTHPLISLGNDIIHNRDYYGTEIRHEGDNPIAQLGQMTGYMVKQFVPFWVRGLQKEVDRGGSAAAMMAPQLGVMPAPADMNRTKAEKLARDLMVARMPQTAKTKEEFERGQLIAKLTNSLRKGEEDASSKISEAVSNGDITPKQAHNIRQNARLTPIEVAFKKLGYEEAQKVMEAANDEEKAKLEKMFRTKARNYRLSHPRNNGD